jgi:hypothetical protein
MIVEKKNQTILRSQIKWHLVSIAIASREDFSWIIYNKDPQPFDTNADAYFAKVKSLEHHNKASKR